jgi:hypothetical protein
VAFLPFATSVLAEALRSSHGERTAVVFYGDGCECGGPDEAVEQPLASAERDRRDADRELVDEAGFERLADRVGAAHEADVLVAGCLAREGDGLLKAPRGCLPPAARGRRG